MKKIQLIPILLLAMSFAQAQSVAEARKLMYHGRYQSAGGQLHTLLRTDPGNAEAWFLLTRVYSHDDKIGVASDSLRKMPAAAANSPLGLCARGYVFLQAGNTDSSKKYFDKALELTRQKDPAVLLSIANAHVNSKAGDANYAIGLLNSAIKRDKRDPQLYVSLGNAWRKLLNGTESYKAYRDAIAQDPKCTEAMYRIGKIFLTQNNSGMYLEQFNQAVATDSLYAPAWYELYYHYYFRDVNRAMECLNHYISSSDKSPENDYLRTDLLYASRKYHPAIDSAMQLIREEGDAAQPRMYKLIAYSYKELGDTTNALNYMQKYFTEQTDTGFVVKDFETMGEIYEKMNGGADSAAHYYTKAAAMEKDNAKRYAYFKKLGELYKKLKDYPQQAFWLGKFYEGNSRSNNLDLFNWGLANYMARDYTMADSIFGIYEGKYPDQGFGYFWRARSRSAIDTAMQLGLAIPDYLRLIDIDAKDSAVSAHRKHLIESYGYIAAYKANTEKNYPVAIGYFEKLLSLDPQNADARKYVEILKKNLNKNDGSRNSPAGTGTIRAETSKAGK